MKNPGNPGRREHESYHEPWMPPKENTFIPAVNIYENDENYIVIAEMPGVGRNDAEVSLENNLLTIRGRMHEKTPHHSRPLLAEYEKGHYMRRFTITETVDQQGIQASMTNGMLRIILPKAQEPEPKKIEITSS